MPIKYNTTANPLLVFKKLQSDLLTYALGVSLSEAEVYGRSVFKLIMQGFSKVCASKFTGICAIIYRQKKHVLNQTLICTALSRFCWALWK